jgi:hypothetical protein
MGWLRYFFLGDLGQQLDLSDHEEEINRLKRELRSQRVAATSLDSSRLQALEQENDELKLYLVAVLRLLVAKKVASVEEIRSLVDIIDREDGRADNKYQGKMLPES